MLSLDALPLAASASNLLAAREQMAFTLGFHIVLSCLGVALPATILVANYIGLKKRRRGRDGAGQTLVEGDGGDLRRRRRHRHRPQLRVRPALAALHGPLRRRLRRSPSRSRGSSSSSRRSSSRSTSTAGSGSRGWAHFWSGVPMFVTGIGGAFSVVAANSWMNQPQGFTLDAAGKVTDVEPLKVLCQPGDRLRGAAHDPRRLHGRRLPGRLDLRGRDAERPARPPAPAGPADPADDRADRDPDPALRRRHRGPRRRRPPAGQVRRHGVHPGNRRPPDRVPRRRLHRERGQVRDPDPRPRLLPGRLQRRHQGHRAQRDPQGRTAARQHDAAPRLRRDGRDRLGPARCSASGSPGSGGKSATSRGRPGSCGRSRSPAAARSWRSGAAGS